MMKSVLLFLFLVPFYMVSYAQEVEWSRLTTPTGLKTDVESFFQNETGYYTYSWIDHKGYTLKRYNERFEEEASHSFKFKRDAGKDHHNYNLIYLANNIYLITYKLVDGTREMYYQKINAVTLEFDKPKKLFSVKKNTLNGQKYTFTGWEYTPDNKKIAFIGYSKYNKSTKREYCTYIFDSDLKPIVVKEWQNPLFSKDYSSSNYELRLLNSGDLVFATISDKRDESTGKLQNDHSVDLVHFKLLDNKVVQYKTHIGPGQFSNMKLVTNKLENEFYIGFFKNQLKKHKKKDKYIQHGIDGAGIVGFTLNKKEPTLKQIIHFEDEVIKKAQTASEIKKRTKKPSTIANDFGTLGNKSTVDLILSPKGDLYLLAEKRYHFRNYINNKGVTTDPSKYDYYYDCNDVIIFSYRKQRGNHWVSLIRKKQSDVWRNTTIALEKPITGSYTYRFNDNQFTLLYNDHVSNLSLTNERPRTMPKAGTSRVVIEASFDQEGNVSKKSVADGSIFLLPLLSTNSTLNQSVFLGKVKNRFSLGRIVK